MAAKKTVLSDRFLIGEELGRGAYGQVFKGMDAQTGDVVAIKQISLSGVSQENLTGVMGEIDLLKTLNHKNIVKYIGSFKTRTHLYIILEFMENGSLSSVIKPNRFGVFPESLVAIYIAQVLQGLAYLHDQGVVHRDIKGANILTTKEGLVKLADFGVAAKLGELETGRDELQQNVVGTPYWMAPEVIEMTQVTAASDIWSVGCLILELLTGYPPYYDLQPMSALFRIVQDDHPPLPESVTPLLDDFLLQCFQKDPAARPDARTLLQHEWIQYNRRTLRSSWTRTQGYRTRGGRGGAAEAHESVTSVVERMLVNAEASGDDGNGSGAGGARGALLTSDAAAGPLATQQDTGGAGLETAGGGGAGVLLPTPPASPVPGSGPATASPAASASPGMPGLQVGSLVPPSRFAEAQAQGAAAASMGVPAPSPRSAAAAAVSIELSTSSIPPPPGDGPAVLQRRLSGNFAGPSGLPRDDGARPVATSTGPRLIPAPPSGGGAPAAWAAAGTPPGAWPQQQTPPSSRDTRSAAGVGAGGIGCGGTAAAAYSGPGPPGPPGLSLSPRDRDLGPGNDWEGALVLFLSRLQGADSGAPTPTARLAQHGSSLSAWLDEADRPAGVPGAKSRGGGGGGYLDTGTYQAPYDANTSQLASGVANVRWGGTGQQQGGAGGGGQLYSRNLSSASLTDSVSGASTNGGGLEGSGGGGGPESSFQIETKRKVRDLVRSLRPGARDANMTPAQACASLSSLFARHPESKQHFLSEGGVLAAMEMLDSDTTKILEPAVELVCAFTAGDTRLLESLCLVGIVPAMCRMVLPAPPGAERLRSRAAGFVQQLCFSGVTTLQMLIACGGLRHLVLLVHDNLQDPSSLTPTGLACIWRALEAPSALPINYTCRLLAQAGLVPRLFAVMRQAVSLQARSERQQQAAAQQQQQQQQQVPSIGVTGGSQTARSGSTLGGQPPPLGRAAWDGGPYIDPSAAGAVAAAAGTLKSPLSSKEVGVAGGLAGGDELGLRPRNGDTASMTSPVLRPDQNGPSAAPAAAQQQPRLPAGALVEPWQATAAPGQTRNDWALEKCSSLLLVLAHADAVVKATICSKDGLQSLLDCLQRLQPPHLVKVMRALRWLTGEPSILPAIKDAGAIGQLVPFLSREREAAVGPAAQLEALQALYNICKFNKRVHLEVAATAGIVQHLCRFAMESSPALLQQQQQLPVLDPLTGAAAAEARRAAVRGFVVPMIIGMASTSSSTRAKLWACNGLDIFLQLLGEEDSQMQVGLLRALDTWLSEDHARVEHRLTSPQAVGQLVELLASICRQRDMATMPQMLDTLKLMLGRSSKLAVAMATGGLVPPLLEPLASPPSGGAPILRARVLEILRALYEHHPRPKEFIMKFRIQDVLRRLLESDGRGEDAVKLEAQKLLNAFHINVLL